jgi:hypothetical protein
MTKVEELRRGLTSELGAFQLTMFGTDTSDAEVDALISASHAEGVEEGYRKGCIEKDTEWRRGYNQGWEERKAFVEQTAPKEKS